MASPKKLVLELKDASGIDWAWRDGAWRPKLPSVAWFAWGATPAGTKCFCLTRQMASVDDKEWIEVVW